MSETVSSKEAAVRFLERMVEIPSPSGEESRLSRFLESEMNSLGYDVHIDQAGNVLGRIGKGAPLILLSGHMDTVPWVKPAPRKEGFVSGRGSVDAKGPLAAMILAGKRLSDEGFKGSIIVACTVQEEGDNRGIRSLIEAGLKADYAVFGEPTNTKTLTVAYKGCLILEVECSTEPGHSSAPWLHTNAIETAMKVYDLLSRLVAKLSDEKEGFEALTTCVRSMKGGRNVGMIPSECKMIIEYRIPPKIGIGFLKEKIEKKLSGYAHENKEVNIIYNFPRSVEPFQADKKSLLVRAFSRMIYREIREPVFLVKKS
jgi:LysW-gamma-L-lysine carboxypeptidase